MLERGYMQECPKKQNRITQPTHVKVGLPSLRVARASRLKLVFLHKWHHLVVRLAGHQIYI